MPKRLPSNSDGKGSWKCAKRGDCGGVKLSISRGATAIAYSCRYSSLFEPISRKGHASSLQIPCKLASKVRIVETDDEPKHRIGIAEQFHLLCCQIARRRADYDPVRADFDCQRANVYTKAIVGFYGRVGVGGQNG